MLITTSILTNLLPLFSTWWAVSQKEVNQWLVLADSVPQRLKTNNAKGKDLQIPAVFYSPKQWVPMSYSCQHEEGFNRYSKGGGNKKSKHQHGNCHGSMGDAKKTKAQASSIVTLTQNMILITIKMGIKGPAHGLAKCQKNDHQCQEPCVMRRCVSPEFTGIFFVDFCAFNVCDDRRICQACAPLFFSCHLCLVSPCCLNVQIFSIPMFSWLTLMYILITQS